jgi:general secretion pathway protein L
MSLRLLIDEARARGEAPVSIALHAGAGVSPPDHDSWQRALGLPLHLAGPWDWRTAASQAGVRLAQPQRRWRIPPVILSRLRPAAWIVGAALAVHAIALVADWSSLAGTQRTLRDAMTAQFRATFPDTVAVVDPLLQMGRKLAEARHAAGRIDRSDFLPMFELVAAAAKDLPAGTLRAVSYEGARMSLVLSSADEAGLRRLTVRLRESGLHVERSQNTSSPGAPAARASQAMSAGATVVLTVRSA